VLTIRLVRGEAKRRGPTLALVVLSWLTVFLFGSRAGLLGAALVGITGSLVILRSRTLAENTRLGVLIIAPLAVAAVLFALPQTVVGQRLIATVGVEVQDQAAHTSAIGTIRARERVWSYLWDYSKSETPRFLIGVGHGPNFMSTTSAGYLLRNDVGNSEAAPRAPHNYWLNTQLREGLVGALLAVMLAVLVLWRSLTRLHEHGCDDLVLLAGLVSLAILPPATLGVVLESPFGAVPFWWCVGILLTATARAARPRGRPAFGSPG
jgi:O-antigen ligase